MSEEAVIDLYEIPHQQRHSLIFMMFERLSPGAGFVIVNDHDPGPLRRQFEMIHGGGFGWKYLADGPSEWRVRISRAGDGAV